MKTLAEKIDEALGHAPASLREAFAAFDIVETEEVATATVAGRAVPVVKVNPRFVAEHCPTPQSLAALLMHEALHVVFGHTSRGGETTQLDNIVWDAVINSILCRMRPEPEWTALFTDLYSESDQLECFLRPVPGFDPSRPVALPSALAPKPRSRGASLYRSLYGRRGVPESDLRAYLADKLPSSVLLLGGHEEGTPQAGGAAEDEEESTRAEEEGAGRRIAREVLRDFQRNVEEAKDVGGQASGGAILERRVTVEAAPRRILASLVRRIGGRDPRFEGTLSWRDTGDIEVLGVLPAPDRRSVLWRAAGASPLLFRRTAPEPGTRRLRERVHLYLDVSGSVESRPSGSSTRRFATWRLSSGETSTSSRPTCVDVRHPRSGEGCLPDDGGDEHRPGGAAHSRARGTPGGHRDGRAGGLHRRERPGDARGDDPRRGPDERAGEGRRPRRPRAARRGSPRTGEPGTGLVAGEEGAEEDPPDERD